MAKHRVFVLEVIFARTPLDAISAKHRAIQEAGWELRSTHPDRWLALYRKTFPYETPEEDARAELMQIMGDRWIDPNGAP